PDTYDNVTELVLTAPDPAPVLRPRLAFTRQHHDADDYSRDVADVPVGGVAIPRLLVHEQVDVPDGTPRYPDEAGPAYSPDGRLLAYSTNPHEVVESQWGEAFFYDLAPGRVLAVGDVDDDPLGPGVTDPRFLDYETEEGSNDDDPAWSPD